MQYLVGVDRVCTAPACGTRDTRGVTFAPEHFWCSKCTNEAIRLIPEFAAQIEPLMDAAVRGHLRS